jgi:hypothetical protein
MKRIVAMTVIMLTVLVSVAMACDETVQNGKLLLFQKCDASLTDPDIYDANGCPLPGQGPWPIFANGAWGDMHYTVLGDKFKFSFEGEKLQINKGYTLIYYPDPWPGKNLICLGSGTTDGAGNIKIAGSKKFTDGDGNPTGLPMKYDANFYPISPSGAVGAKIWLVPSADVTCTGDITNPTAMVAWNPAAYLFEGNMIVYQYQFTNEPPKIINASATPSVLWPPNHKMVNIAVRYSVKDDHTKPSDVTCTLNVTSNESISADDYAIVDPHHVKLRSERDGGGSGRIYTITITCVDKEGLSSSKEVAVVVPHDKGKKK